MSESNLNLLAISVGNTSTRFGLFTGKELSRSVRAPNAALAPLVDQLARMAGEIPEDGAGAVVLASVNDKVAGQLLDALVPRLSHEFYRIGVDLQVPIARALAPEATPGQDRLLNALAAYDALSQACVVVDAGTALTVDFVDGEGVFQGGAILPGAQMMLDALRARTAALPEVSLARPGPEAFGKNTVQAMLNGVHFGIRGAVRAIVERYAEAYEAFPLVVATGGDAVLLLEDDPIIDRLVPDLTLRGIEVSCRAGLAPGSAAGGREG